jgi:hypothetical protein
MRVFVMSQTAKSRPVKNASYLFLSQTSLPQPGDVSLFLRVEVFSFQRVVTEGLDAGGAYNDKED